MRIYRSKVDFENFYPNNQYYTTINWHYKPWMVQTKCSVYFLMNATSPDDYHVVDKVEVHPSEVRGSQDYVGYITANCVGELQGNFWGKKRNILFMK